MEQGNVYLAITTITVAISGVIFTGLQVYIAHKKRKDDLFNLRYEYYKKVSKIWIDSYIENQPLEFMDLLQIAEKADFLFGKDIRKHILSLADKKASHDSFPDDDFSKPFHKYLKLK